MPFCYCCCCSWEFSLAVGLGQLESMGISVTRAVSQSAQISCKVSLEGFDKVDIHWYRQKTNQPFEYLIYIRNDNTHRPLEGISKKIEARKDLQTSTATLIINSLKKEDEAIYYCALWVEHNIKASRTACIRTISHLCQPTSFSAGTATCCTAEGPLSLSPPQSSWSCQATSRVLFPQWGPVNYSLKARWPHTISYSVRVSERYSNIEWRACSMTLSFVNSLHKGLQ